MDVLFSDGSYCMTAKTMKVLSVCPPMTSAMGTSYVVCQT